MLTKRWFATVLTMLLATTVAMAQDRPNEGGSDQDQPPRRERRQRPAGDQDRPGPGGRFGGFAGRGMEEQIKAITEQLKLDEQQQASVKEMVDAHMKKVQELQEANRPSEEEMAKMREFREAMRAAREANDENKMQELRDQMQESNKGQRERMTAMREKTDALNKELHDGLAGIMHEDQKEAFEKAWNERMNRQRGPANVDPRQLKRVVDGLEGMSTQQKDQIQALFTAHQEKTRELSEKPRELQQANRKLYEDVIAVLDDAQKAKVQREVQARGGERGRFDREGGDRPRGRRERPGRGGDEPAGDRP